MDNFLAKGIVFFLSFGAFLPIFAQEEKKADEEFKPVIFSQYIDDAKKNNNWKKAFATAKNAQVVLMNISPSTNPKNEIGMETHSFDQVILIVEGRGKAILNGQTFSIKEGDMILIPEGKKHNLVNAEKEKALKLISFYSERDIPINAVYKMKSEELLEGKR